jgi:SOS-response transcriptional repressor LexA
MAEEIRIFRNDCQAQFRIIGIAEFLFFRKHPKSFSQINESEPAMGMASVLTIADIAEGLKQPGKSKKGLAKALGRQPSAVTELLKGNREIKAREVPIIVDYLGLTVALEKVPFATNVSNSLATSYDPDAEDMSRSGAAYEGGLFDVPAGEIPQVAAQLGLGLTADAHVIEIPVGGGSKAAVEVVDTWKIPETILRRRISGSLRSIHIVECRGDSMSPRIKDGDFVFIDTAQRTPSPPGVFALWDGMGQTLKNLEYIPNSEPPQVRIIPDNEKYSTYERNLEEVSIIGRYICRLTMD